MHGVSRSRRLSQFASSFTAEICGLIEALEIANQSHQPRFTIFSDSRSVLQSIAQYNSTNPLIQKIQTLLLNLQSTEKVVSLCWCPAHVGVPQNEAVDGAARAAAQSDDRPIDNSVPYRDHYTLIKSLLKSKWNEEWSNITGNKLRIIKNHINPPSEPIHPNRRYSIILTRLRIGHSLLTHQHLMERRPAPMCIFCDLCTMTIRHILAECTQLTISRSLWFPFANNNDPAESLLNKILTNNHKTFNINAIINFLMENNILHRI